MRTFFIILFCYSFFFAGAQPSKPKETCEWIEVFIKSALNNFSDAKFSSTPTRKYTEDYDMGGIYHFEEYDTRFRWPGATRTFLRVSTASDETEQIFSLISPYEDVDTKEKAYAQLKKLYSELTPCTVTPVPGQKAILNGEIPSLEKSLVAGRFIMDATFKLPNGKKRVKVLLSIVEKGKKFFAEMEVQAILEKADIVIPKCNALQTVANQLRKNFAGEYGRLRDSSGFDLRPGSRSQTLTYIAKNQFPGSDGTWIKHTTLNKNGKLSLDNWSLKAWYRSNSFEEGKAQYKKLFQQLQGCTVQSPAGRTIVLTGEYKEPVMGQVAIFDFKTQSESESFFISITLEKEDNLYYTWLSIALHKL